MRSAASRPRYPGAGASRHSRPYSAKTASVIGHQNLRKLQIADAIERARAKPARLTITS